MLSRYSSRLLQRAPVDSGSQTFRDLIETHHQSLGFRKLDKIKIDCSFLPDSKWGTLGDSPGKPAWLLYLKLYATAVLTFENLAPKDIDPKFGAGFGPTITDYYGPRGLTGPVDLDFEGKIEATGSPQISQETGMQWSLNATALPVDGDESGLHRQVEWIIKEANPPYQTILHRDQVRVALVLRHDSEPFSITVQIKGELQKKYSWYKFYPGTDYVSCPCIRVSPNVHQQIQLDDIAERLNHDMIQTLFQSFRSPCYSAKRPMSEDKYDVYNERTKKWRLDHRPHNNVPMQEKVQLTLADYTIGWICALPLEMAAAKVMLDKVHTDLPLPSNDHNDYILGNIGLHNIAIACLPDGVYGTTSATVVAAQMMNTFSAIRIGLMVGIGGGVPNMETDIRLGDVVVSKPTGRFGGVIQYDYGKAIKDKELERTGTLNKPPQAVLTTVAKMEAEHLVCGNRIASHLARMANKHPQMQKFFTHRDPNEDILFRADYYHSNPQSTCETCDISKLVSRTPRLQDTPVVHYGTIASGNQVMKDGMTRDRLAAELGILCFEMEAAGLMDSFPCLVIRGICDYADSHKNNGWQEYAAATAAAYAKEFLCMTPARQIAITPKPVLA